ncbi:MAG: T9SS type A sorting domain-containing protein [Bacteroidota bacterium]
MKQLITLLIFSFQLTFPFAQEWAPIGSKWIYSYYFNTEEEPIFDYLFNESIADTFIDGKVVRKINFYRNDNINGNQLLRTEYLYMENNRVYFYKWNDFNLLYDFNLQINDSYPVQSIDNESISGLFTCTNKYLYNSKTYFELASSDELYFGAEVMDWVGSMKDFFPTSEAVFPPEYKRLRCFVTADSVYYQEEDWETFCEHFRTLRISELEQSGLQFSPNPLSSESTLTIPSEYGKIGEIRISSLSGQQAGTAVLQDRQLTLSKADFTSGLYFIEVETENKRLFGKFVVE